MSIGYINNLSLLVDEYGFQLRFWPSIHNKSIWGMVSCGEEEIDAVKNAVTGDDTVIDSMQEFIDANEEDLAIVKCDTLVDALRELENKLAKREITDNYIKFMHFMAEKIKNR